MFSPGVRIVHIQVFACSRRHPTVRLSRFEGECPDPHPMDEKITTPPQPQIRFYQAGWNDWNHDDQNTTNWISEVSGISKETWMKNANYDLIWNIAVWWIAATSLNQLSECRDCSCKYRGGGSSFFVSIGYPQGSCHQVFLHAQCASRSSL